MGCSKNEIWVKEANKMTNPTTGSIEPVRGKPDVELLKKLRR